jgi:hypothetical protein
MTVCHPKEYHIRPHQELSIFDEGVNFAIKHFWKHIEQNSKFYKWSEEYITWIHGIQLGIGEAAARGETYRRLRLMVARGKGKHKQWEWKQLCREFGNRCVCCGQKSKKLQKDHILPISYGGSDLISNIQPLCGSCNASKGSDSFDWAQHRRDNGF